MNKFDEKLKDICRQMLETSLIAGTCYIKMTVNEDTKEIEFEILNPFYGCECGEPNSGNE